MKENEASLEPRQETIQAVLQEEAYSIHDNLHVLQDMKFFFFFCTLFHILY